MSILISAENLQKTFAVKELFSKLNLSLHSYHKTALIGVNGCGKSTLLKMLAKMEEADSGDIIYNSETRISFLNQNPDFSSQQTILEYILSGENPLFQLIRDYEQTLTELETDYSEATANKLDQLQNRMSDENGYQVESQIKGILAELEINNPQQKMADLSGGMIKKASLCKTLVGQSNVLFLDEPTNHLDIKTIIWLENYLRKTDKAVVIITHDRYFLDGVCNQIIELEGGKAFTYAGNFSYYLEKKIEREDQEASEQKKLANIIRNELKWIRRGPKARGGKQKARKDRFVQLNNQVDGPKQELEKFSSQEKRLGGKIINLENINFSYTNNTDVDKSDKKIISNFSYYFQKGERLGVVGPNGVGKSTLLNILAGELEPTSGEIDVGVNTAIAYFDQNTRFKNENLTVLEHMSEVAKNVKLPDGSSQPVTRYLERFQFPTGMFNTSISKLSGGEKKRLYLITLLTQNPNFLMMDEPTNDLDIRTLSLLEDFLSEYKGCLLVVSHDRYFLDRAVDHLLILDHDTNGNVEISGYPGLCSEYLEEDYAFVNKPKTSGNKSNSKNTDLSSSDQGSGSQNSVITPLENSQNPKSNESKGLSYKEQKEFESLESAIEDLENKKRELEDFFSSPESATDIKKLEDSNKKYELVQSELQSSSQRWEELAERSI